MTHSAGATKTSYSLRAAVVRTVVSGAILNVFAIVLAYFAYWFDLGVSLLPGRISIAIAAVCLGGPLLILLLFRRSTSLVIVGIVKLLGALSIYALIGITFYFFFFAFAPMPDRAHLVSLAMGAALTGYWLAFSYVDLRRFIRHSTFVDRAFDASGNAIVCDDRLFEIFEDMYEQKTAFSIWHTRIVMAIVPVLLVPYQVATFFFGTQGLLFFVAAITFPVSLWIVGAMLRIAMVMILVPATLQRQSGKRVLLGPTAWF